MKQIIRYSSADCVACSLLQIALDNAVGSPLLHRKYGTLFFAVKRQARGHSDLRRTELALARHEYRERHGVLLGDALNQAMTAVRSLISMMKQRPTELSESVPIARFLVLW